MLNAEENDIISRVGPDTPMGKLMREYWQPAMLSSELPGPDCDPVRIMLLGEQLIAFRDTNGRIGLIANHCPHRGASLFFGRNEECGLRCVYHGWKFDVEGNCVDMPNEPAESNFKHKIKAVAYPCQERSGLVWAYMGSRQVPPPLPELEANMLPDGEWGIAAIERDCNWLQALEGDIDTSHLAFLHFGTVKPDDVPEGTFQHYLVKDRAPRYSVLDTDYGTMYGAYRDGPPGTNYWRIAQYLFPCHTIIPTGVLGLQIFTRSWVPMDDGHTMAYTLTSRDWAETVSSGRARTVFPALQPNTTDWFGRFRMAQTMENDYLIDRDRQRRGEDWTGIPGIHTQDQAITESMGPILDRSGEHVGTADVMVIRTRRRILAAVRDLVERGLTPPGVDDPAAYRQRAGGVFLPKDADWLQATEELRKAFVEHPELSQALSGGA